MTPDIKDVFNVAFPLAVASAAFCFTVLAAIINSSKTVQESLCSEGLNSTFTELRLATTTITDFVKELRTSQLSIVTIPDRVAELRIMRAYIYSGILLSISLLIIVVLFDVGVAVALLKPADHYASLLLTRLSLLIDLFCMAVSIVIASRHDIRSAIFDIFMPVRK